MSDARILVADDDAASRVILKRLLERVGYRVALVEDGRSAVERVLAEAPMLALLDLNMPILDGFEAAAAIRRRRSVPAIPLIAMSATAEGEFAGRMGDFDDFLVKPLARQALLACVQRWSRGGDGAVLDSAVLGELELEVGSDSVAEVLRVFFVEMGRRVDEIASAAHCGGLETVQRAAHQLKANAGTVGAPHLARCAAALEAVARDGDAGETARLAGELPTAAAPVLGELRSRVEPRA